ncbi:MAG TPA: Gfo/Idh/MocA family oxidoreductase [Clostridia bacterium]|mgnify:FL=1|jgi:predicted dehydrogenase|nr:Gfo/Idh/MocA family oxidoreductase [Clostridia bacterium]HUM61742.1 Gfo/Idh/MocA family oxidoreductase [Clostridia bacterium]
MNKVKMGIIGLGNMGSSHLKFIMDGLTPQITLAAVAERMETRRRKAREIIPQDISVYEEGSELIAAGICDAVLIATPHYQHPGLAIQAFKRGLHVMCEKPAGVYTLDVREMIKQADLHPQLSFGMMFNQRTNPLYIKMHEMISSGQLGKLKRVNWIITDWYRTQYYYDSGAWRATWAGEGGGVLLNQCPHQLDLLQWLCGMPVRVRAFLHEGKWHDIEVEDDVTAYLEYSNGATGVFITTTGDAPGTNRLEVTGTLGKLVCENDELIFHRLGVDEREWCVTAKQGFAVPPVEVIRIETDSSNPQHVGVLNAFASNILHGSPLVADGREGIKGLMLSNAMHLSSWTDKMVSLPFDEEEYLALLNLRRASSRIKEDQDLVLNTSGSY